MLACNFESITFLNHALIMALHCVHATCSTLSFPSPFSGSVTFSSRKANLFFESSTTHTTSAQVS
ncbi:hypothetical protein RND81_07G043300 [Saponaria officinalis]|uniref:Uncharacterized protein n=1 Tax=Saponaria officinalis TaxID=3572 RepID=A0AAW1JN27_SAPOF